MGSAQSTSTRYQALTVITLFMLALFIAPDTFAQTPTPKSPNNQSPGVVSPKNHDPQPLDAKNHDPQPLNTVNQDPAEVDAVDQDSPAVRKGRLASKQPPKSKLIVKQSTNGNFVLTSVPGDNADLARDENLAKESQAQPQNNNSLVNGLTKEQRLNRRLEIAQQQRLKLESDINELQTRALQNRPTNPSKAGDPYYVDPVMHKQMDTLKQQLADTQKQIDELVDELNQTNGR